MEVGTSIEKLTPISPEVISNQATINIGTIGHVAHGKSTLVKALTGVDTVRFKDEKVRSITIHLGYANAKIYQCDTCPRPLCYRAFGSNQKANSFKCKNPNCRGTMTLKRHVSFVDCFAPETVVMMSDGSSKQIREIQVGDQVMGDDGKPRNVLQTQSGRKDLYQIKYETQLKNPVQDLSFTCTSGHILVLRIDTPVRAPCLRNNHYIVHYFQSIEDNGVKSVIEHFPDKTSADCFYDSLDKTPVIYEITVENYLELPVYFKKWSRLFRSKELNFERKLDLSIESASNDDIAWLIGLWLADGNKSCSRITVSKQETEILDKLKEISEKANFTINIYSYPEKDAYEVYLGKNKKQKNSFVTLLRDLQILNDKHVPNKLKFSDTNTRYALLSGMIDGDGHYSKGEFEIVQGEDHYNLLMDIAWVSRSLGFSTRISEKLVKVNYKGTAKTFKHYRANFNGNLSTMSIINPHKKGKSLERLWATSQPFTVQELEDGPFVGIETDGNNRFLLEDFIVVHNCPGHDCLMATMINGTSVMDTALLIVGGNQPCPQPQTQEHLAAAEIMQLQNIGIIQNKVDLLPDRETAKENYRQIKEFVKGTVAEQAPIIPTSAVMKQNIDAVCDYICNQIPLPEHDFSAPARMIIVRSFDINQPGTEISELKGGVPGGTLIQGILRVGQEVEIRPGVVKRLPSGQVTCQPLRTIVKSLYAEKNKLDFAVPGGLIGVGTNLDPSLTKKDCLKGQVIGHPGTLPDILIGLEISYFLMKRLIGSDDQDKNSKPIKVVKMAKDEILMINVGSISTKVKVTAVKGDLAKFRLQDPICSPIGEKIAISRRIDEKWRLVGWGKIMAGTPVPV